MCKYKILHCTPRKGDYYNNYGLFKKFTNNCRNISLKYLFNLIKNSSIQSFVKQSGSINSKKNIKFYYE